LFQGEEKNFFSREKSRNVGFGVLANRRISPPCPAQPYAKTENRFKKSGSTMGLLSFIVFIQQFLFVITAALPGR
jgi:hypothetical protein